MPKRRALLSVSDKTGIVDLGRGLADHGFEVISTGGTARALASAGVAVTGVADLTGYPEMLDGRVKTLHPAIHGGILARRSHPGDLAALERLGIGPIDVVAVNLYPFGAAAAKPGLAVADLIEEIDIGGPTLVRAAAKNFHDVLVLVRPADYAGALEEIARPGGPSLEFRLRLAQEAFDHTAAYDAMIAETLASVRIGPSGLERAVHGEGGLPSRLFVRGVKLRDLRYGENPHQRGAWYAAAGGHGLGGARVLQGKELSYTNLLDLDAALRIALEFEEPAAVVIKHTNPCGVATGTTPAEAYVLARDADPLSAFGGIVGLNRPVDEATAAAIVSTFIEAVVAPGFEGVAQSVLSAKKNLRLVEVAAPAEGSAAAYEVRSLEGAFLLQEIDRVAEARAPWPEHGGALKVVTRRQPTAEEWRALRFAWRVCGHVKSNAVVFTTPNQTAGIGAGQMSRVDAVKVATMKADRGLRGTVAASDAFFPFRDGVDAIAAAGATAVVQPGGSVKDAEVVAAADEHGLAMVFTGRRHFRH